MTFETWLQTRLREHGYSPGPIDGAVGPKTRAALQAFQRGRGLAATGEADAATVTALRAAPLDAVTGLPASETPVPAAPIRMPPWYAEAGRLMGLREVSGRSHSPTIMGWAWRLGLRYPDDETPWCGLFVAHCIAFALPNEPLPANPLGARNWLKFGRALKSPALGAILVFSRPGSSWSGHVGFHAGERADAYRVRGGNQSNAVTETWITKHRLLGARRPSAAPVQPCGPGRIKAPRDDGSALSTNEA